MEKKSNEMSSEKVKLDVERETRVTFGRIKCRVIKGKRKWR